MLTPQIYEINILEKIILIKLFKKLHSKYGRISAPSVFKSTGKFENFSFNLVLLLYSYSS